MQQIRAFKEIWDKYMFILTSKQKIWGSVLLVMTIIGALFETLGVSVILPLVQVMITPEVLYENKIIIYFQEVFQIQMNQTTLVWLVGIFVAMVYIVKNVYLFLVSYFRARYGCKVQRELSVEMMQAYMRRGYLFFLNSTTGELLRGMRDSVSNTYEGLYQILRALAEIFTVICICIYVMISDATMAVCVICLAIICLLSIVLGFKKWTKRSGEITFKYDALISKTLLQAFHGIKEVLVMHRQNYFVDVYKEQYIKRQTGIIGKTVALESPAYLIEGTCVVGLLIAVCFKATNTQDAANLVPQLAAFAVAAFRIMPSLGRISSSVNSFIICIPGINETNNNLKKVRENKDIEIDVKEMPSIESTSEFNWNDIVVNNISWCYSDAGKKILDEVSISIEKGKSVAFVGPSGAGKTTFADILLGLLKPQSGQIMIGGVDISELAPIWKNIIGFVPQNAYLLDDTVKNNVAFGMAEVEIDEKSVWRALEEAQLKEFVESLPDGINTMVGERGTRISGGQRQRLAIARALYNNPDILVLDEATSALDTETEKAVMEAIDSLHGTKTLIIIAHRLTTIKNCDEIYKIDEGKAKKVRYEELV